MSNIRFPVKADCSDMDQAVGTNDTSQTLGLSHYALEQKINIILEALRRVGILEDK